MSPLIMSLVDWSTSRCGVFAALYAFMRDSDQGRASERLDLLVGRTSRQDSSADMLLKQNLAGVRQENVSSIVLTPEVLDLTTMIEQADANVKPSALFGVGLVAGALGGSGDRLPGQHLTWLR